MPAIRERMLASLVNVSESLATEVARGLGVAMPGALPRALPNPPAAEVTESPALSLTALPGDGGIKTRQIAFVVADGVSGAACATVHAALCAQGAVVHFVGPRIGQFTADDGTVIEADMSLENAPSVLFDALVLPDGDKAVSALIDNALMLEYVRDQYRHCKSLFALGASRLILEVAGVPAADSEDRGVICVESDDAPSGVSRFSAAVAKHRHFVREMSAQPA